MLKGKDSRVQNWDDLRYLMAVHKTGSMSAASRLLDTNPATVSRRLARLAEALGHELFHKTPEGWVASEAIGPLLQSVSSFEGEIESYLNANDTSEGQLRGTISVGMPGSLANGVLYPRMTELVALHPGIRLNLHAQTYRETLGENDLIISPIRPQQGRLIVKPIGRVHSNLFCFPDSIKGGPWIGLLRDHDGHEPMQKAMHMMGGEPPALRVETLFDAAEAMRATRLPGLTLALYAAQQPDMQVYDASVEGNETALYLCYHETRRHDPLLQAVIEWATRAFEECEHL